MLFRIKRKRFKFLFTSLDGRNRLLIKGPVTTLSFPLPTDCVITPQITSSSKYLNSLFNQISNFRELIFGTFCEIVPEGVGFRYIRYPWAPQVLGLSLGYSHSIYWKLPSQITFRAHKYRLLMFSGNRSILNEVALHIIRLRTPDAYKAKGLKFPRDMLNLKLKPGKLRQR